jgi:hypothetical protein
MLALAASLLCSPLGCWQGTNTNMERANTNIVCAEGLIAERDEHGEWGCYKRSALALPSQTADECAQVGVGADEYRVWKESGQGFDCDGAAHWIEVGVRDPNQAAEWCQLVGLEPGGPKTCQSDSRAWSAAAACLRSGVGLEAARRLKGYGLNPEEIAAACPFISAGYPPEKSAGYAEHNSQIDLAGCFASTSASGEERLDADCVRERVVLYEASVRDAQARQRRLRVGPCHGQVEDNRLLLLSNPYAITGKCFEVWGAMYQWFGPTQGLANLFFGGSTVRVVFDRRPAGVMFKGTAIARKPYQFEDTSGALRTVVNLEVLE